MKVTKAQLAQEVIEYLINAKVIKEKPISEYSDEILDIQDIFSQYWDESEITE